MIDFEVIRDRRALASHAPAWSALCDRSATLFARPEWLRPWIAQFGSQLDLAVVLVWRDRELAALLPFHETRPAPFERVLTLACNDHTPEGQLAVDPRHRDAVLAAFVRWALGRKAPWTRIELAKLATDSPDYLALQRALAADSTLAYERRERHTHRTLVEGDWDEFLRARSKNFRKHVRKAERALRDHRLSVELLEEPAAIDDAFEELARISRSSWQGKVGSGAFAEPRAAAFYRSTAIEHAQRGAAPLFICKRGGEAIGYILYLEAAGRLEALKSEFDERWAECLVGWQIAARAYQHAATRSVRTISMGSWRTEFKRRWTTDTIPLSELTVFAPTLLGGARYLFPHLSKELAKRALGKPSVARCLPLLDFTPQ